MANVIHLPGQNTMSTSISHPVTIMNEIIREGKTFRVPTGWKTFDDASNGGLICGHCTFMCGAPNAGKTAMLACLTEFWLNQGIPVCALMIDEDRVDFFMRWATILGYNMTECDERKEEMVREVGAYLAAKSFRILGRTNPVTKETITIESAAEHFALEFPNRRVIMINDSLQRIRSKTIKGNETERQYVNKNAESLEIIAKSNRWFIVATSEVARAGYIESKDFNDMAAGKNSGDIEYIAKAQLVVRRLSDDSDIRKVTVPKLKRGKKDQTHFYLKFDRENHTLVECDDIETPKSQLNYHVIKSFFEQNKWEFVGSKNDMYKKIGGKRQQFFDLLVILQQDKVIHFIYSDSKFVWDINKR